MGNFKKSIPSILGLIGATSLAYITGGLVNNTMLSLISSVCGNIAASHLFNISPQKIKDWFFNTHPDDLNHSIKKLYINSIGEALTNINILFSQSNASDNEKKDATAILKKIRKEIKQDFFDSTLIKIEDSNIKNLIYSENTGEVETYLIEELKKDGISDTFAKFLSVHLASQIQLCFGEGLKKDENRDAWVAFQRMLIEDIKDTVTRIEENQNSIKEELSDIKHGSKGLSQEDLNEIRQLKKLLNNKELVKVKFNKSYSDSIKVIEDKANYLIDITTETNLNVKKLNNISGKIRRNQKTNFIITVSLLSILVILAIVAIIPRLDYGNNNKIPPKNIREEGISTTIIDANFTDKEIIFDVSLMDYKEVIKQLNYEEKYKLQWSYPYFKYIDTVIDNIYTILPYQEYYNNYYHKHFIDASVRNEYNGLFRTHSCVLDVKIINNSDATIALNKIVIDVLKSEPDKTPFLGVYSDPSFTSHLFFVNESYAKWKGFDFEFTILREGEHFNGNFNNKIYVPYFKEQYNLDLRPFIQKVGFNYEKLLKETKAEMDEDGKFIHFGSIYNDSLKKYNKYAYPFKFVLECDRLSDDELLDDEMSDDEMSDDELYEFETYKIEANLIGRITFRGYPLSIDVQARIPITTEAGFGSDFICSTAFDVKLLEEGENYQIDFPVSLLLKPHEAERVALKIKAGKSSSHQLKIRLDNINRFDIMSKVISLTFIQPRIFQEIQEEAILFEKEEGLIK